MLEEVPPLVFCLLLEEGRPRVQQPCLLPPMSPIVLGRTPHLIEWLLSWKFQGLGELIDQPSELLRSTNPSILLHLTSPPHCCVYTLIYCICQIFGVLVQAGLLVTELVKTRVKHAPWQICSLRRQYLLQALAFTRGSPLADLLTWIRTVPDRLGSASLRAR